MGEHPLTGWVKRLDQAAHLAVQHGMDVEGEPELVDVKPVGVNRKAGRLTAQGEDRSVIEQEGVTGLLAYRLARAAALGGFASRVISGDFLKNGGSR